MTLIMQLWGTIMDMATNGGIIEQAFRKVEGLERHCNDSPIKEEVNNVTSVKTSQSEPETEEDLEKEEGEE